MTVKNFIELFRRQIYNGQPSDDATITVGLVKTWLPQAAAFAAKSNYKENVALDGIGYVNNSFYSKFSGISISSQGNFIWRITLPQIPLGIGANEGISTIELVDSSNGQVTRPFIPMTERQKTFYQSMRPIQNKVLYYYEGKYLYAISTLILSAYTANVVMVSGGDFALTSDLNVPDDYIAPMFQYLQQQLLLEKAQPVDDTNDGLDATKTT